MTNALLWSNIAKIAENCPLFQRFMGAEIKRALSYNVPECIMHTHLTSIVENVQLASRPFLFSRDLGREESLAGKLSQFSLKARDKIHLLPIASLR